MVVTSLSSLRICGFTFWVSQETWCWYSPLFYIPVISHWPMRPSPFWTYSHYSQLTSLHIVVKYLSFKLLSLITPSREFAWWTGPFLCLEFFYTSTFVSVDSVVQYIFPSSVYWGKSNSIYSAVHLPSSFLCSGEVYKWRKPLSVPIKCVLWRVDNTPTLMSTIKSVISDLEAQNSDLSQLV